MQATHYLALGIVSNFQLSSIKFYLVIHATDKDCLKPAHRENCEIVTTSVMIATGHLLKKSEAVHTSPPLMKES